MKKYLITVRNRQHRKEGSGDAHNVLESSVTPQGEGHHHHPSNRSSNGEEGLSLIEKLKKEAPVALTMPQVFPSKQSGTTTR